MVLPFEEDDDSLSPEEGGHSLPSKCPTCGKDTKSDEPPRWLLIAAFTAIGLIVLAIASVLAYKICLFILGLG